MQETERERELGKEERREERREEQKEERREERKEGVTALAPRKDSKGRWLPGVSGNPAGSASVARRHETAIIEAIKARVSPDDLADGLAWLINPANHPPNTWRPIHAGLELVLKYTVGPAPARAPEAENTIDVILARMREAK